MAQPLSFRELATYDDPGWYKHPKGTVSVEATAADLKRYGITV